MILGVAMGIVSKADHGLLVESLASRIKRVGIKRFYRSEKYKNISPASECSIPKQGMKNFMVRKNITGGEICFAYTIIIIYHRVTALQMR